MRTLRQIIALTLLALVGCAALQAQELNARVVVNAKKVNASSTSVFDDLQTALTEFINTRQWTNMQFKANERIQCVFTIIVNKYDESENSFTCTLNVQATRPVYNSSYTTTVFSFQDNNFNFTYQSYDKLEFRSDVIDNELTALIGYYANLLIGMDGDSMAPLGGTDALTEAQTIVNNSQSFSSKGWKAFDSDKNRYAIVNDLLDGGMEPFRRMQYKYYREGLDQMADNAEVGRAAIGEALQLLKEARSNKPLSALPVLFTEYKADEIVNIFKEKGTTKERAELQEMLSDINASKNTEWNKLK